jgi:phosphate transport system regulatory protein PhoU
VERPASLATELESAAQSLAEERDLVAKVVTAMTEAVIAVDRDLHITLVNPAAAELLGLSEKAPGMALVEAVRVPALVELAERCQEKGTDIARFDLVSGQLRHVMARATALEAAGGLVIVLHDVTESRRLEAMRRDFVANVSHELRTPVSVIRANAEMLLDGALDDPTTTRTFLTALSRNAERLAGIIADLLDLARIESGVEPMELELLRLAPIANRVVESLDGLVRERRTQVRSEVDPGFAVRADPRATDHVLTNLISNAIQHNPASTRVVIRARANPEVARIEVIDDGPGIPQAHRSRIFERFYRLDPGRSREMGGTGLGLSIVKRLVHAMGGRVGVDQAEPRGSLFWFELPATQTPVEGGRRGRAPPRPLRALPPGAAPPAPRPQDPRPARAQPEYARRLQTLRELVLTMAGRVEEMIAESTRALVEQDPSLARATIAKDRKVNQAEVAADRLCLEILTTWQPEPGELRFLTTSLKMVTDLERIGDLAVNICERVPSLTGVRLPISFADLERMSQIAQSQVHDAIDAFVSRDLEKAHQVMERDREVDALYARIFDEVLALMRANPTTIHPGIHVQSVVKWLERIGDHSTNLAEQVIFLVQGQDVRHRGHLEAVADATRGEER